MLLLAVLMMGCINAFVACSDIVAPEVVSEDEPALAVHHAEVEGEVFVVVEEMPELLGGLASIQQELRYPQLAKQAGIEGRVILQFIVDKNGQVRAPKVIRGIGGGCDAEALRALQQARFKPGRQNGEQVNVKMSIPVTFRLQGEASPTPSASLSQPDHQETVEVLFDVYASKLDDASLSDAERRKVLVEFLQEAKDAQAN